jgi:alpha-amylase
MAFINGTMMQYFHWYNADDGNHWKQLQADAVELARSGFTALWIPPAYKDSYGGVGYSTYDLFDLGEFDQKGRTRTKYGTKAELIAAVKASQSAGMSIYLDTVFNHKNGGDNKEKIEAIAVATDNRNYNLGGEETIEAWTNFEFPGRGDTYSSMKWHWYHFDSVNHNSLKPGDSTVYRFKQKQFETDVNPQHGNYDFLMACDLDTSEPQVQGELKYWGDWVVETLGLDGFRLDAVKHVRAGFFAEWLQHVRSQSGKELFTVGEYWSQNLAELHHFIARTQGQVALFDVPLHYNFERASKAGSRYDLRQIFEGTLVQQQPTLAVTLVDNHDTQPLQALESWVEPWFKPLAYSMILLRQAGYPCVFYPDYYGAEYTDKGRDGKDYPIILVSHRFLLDRFLAARRDYAYGPEYSYFNHPNCVGWTRLGDREHPKAMAVLLSNSHEGYKWMEVGKPNTKFVDITEHIAEPVQSNQQGWANFRCKAGSVSVWVQV